MGKAFELYQSAADKRHGKGMELVGRFYNRGIAVDRNRKAAKYWLEKAMTSADPDAVVEARKEISTVDW